MGKKPKATPQPGHDSLKARPKLKGGYYRRVKDIRRAFDELDFDKLPEVVQFLFLFFGCEKLALGIIGLDEKFAADDAYGKGKFVVLEKVKASAASLKMSITDAELDLLFGPSGTSARGLRHKLAHDIGPSNVTLAKEGCAKHIPTMRKFLSCIDEFHAYQESTFGS